MAKKLFGQTGNFPLKDFKDKTALEKVETKRKPGIIETASEETRKKLLKRNG